MSFRLLILSRDSTGLDVASSTANRWRVLRDQGVELDILIASSKAGVWSEPGLHVVGTGGSFFLVRFLRLLRLAKQQALNVQAISAQDPFELGWIAFLMARRFKKPFEIQDHGGFFDGVSADEPLWFFRSRLACFLARRATRIRTVSPGSVRGLERLGLKQKTYFLPIAIHDRFTKIVHAPEKELIVCVARLVKVKRVALVLQSFAEWKKIHPEGTLAVVGEGPCQTSLEALAQRLGIASSVQWVGHTDPGSWLARASCFILLSAHEGWGLASVEAATVGVPVVMSDTGCARYLEARGLAVVVTTQDPVSLARSIDEARQLTLAPFTPPVFTDVAQQQVRYWSELASLM